MTKKTIVIIFVILLLLPSLAFAKGDKDIINEGVNSALAKYKDEIGITANIIIAFSAIASVLIFIIHFLRLGGYHAHSFMRKKVIADLMVSAGCTAIIGAFGLLFKIYLEIFVS